MIQVTACFLECVGQWPVVLLIFQEYVAHVLLP